ncbi:MAG: hypothetical protein HRT70_04860 [Flavobacteriaceae bacterium]|nr:hypothetical protein [Flavobacteriaceae bacterium]
MSTSQQNLNALNELLSHEWMTPKRMMYLMSRQYAFANMHDIYRTLPPEDVEEIAHFNTHLSKFFSILAPEPSPTD